MKGAMRVLRQQHARVWRQQQAVRTLRRPLLDVPHLPPQQASLASRLARLGSCVQHPLATTRSRRQSRAAGHDLRAPLAWHQRPTLVRGPQRQLHCQQMPSLQPHQRHRRRQQLFARRGTGSLAAAGLTQLPWALVVAAAVVAACTGQLQ